MTHPSQFSRVHINEYPIQSRAQWTALLAYHVVLLDVSNAHLFALPSSTADCLQDSRRYLSQSEHQCIRIVQTQAFSLTHRYAGSERVVFCGKVRLLLASIDAVR